MRRNKGTDRRALQNVGGMWRDQAQLGIPRRIGAAVVGGR